MREVFCRGLIGHAFDRDFVFLAGDRGFKALEPLRAAMPDRFINAGVAEQNMICVAAGLAHHHAQGYISGLYGSQGYHRRECKIDASSVLATLYSETESGIA